MLEIYDQAREWLAPLMPLSIARTRETVHLAVRDLQWDDRKVASFTTQGVYRGKAELQNLTQGPVALLIARRPRVSCNRLYQGEERRVEGCFL
jgi:hypothetical protein